MKGILLIAIGYINDDATKKMQIKHEYARSNLFETQTENLNRKFYTAQYVK